jgi:hypothetical protein
MRRTLIAAVLAALATPALAQLPTPVCQADLAAVDASFDETVARLFRLGKAPKTEQCAAVQHHIDVMLNARDVYLRCLRPGHDRDESIAQLNVSIADFYMIQQKLGCGAAPAPAAPRKH